MDALLSDLDGISGDVQAMLREGMPSFDADADSLPWLNVSEFFLSMFHSKVIVFIIY